MCANKLILELLQLAILETIILCANKWTLAQLKTMLPMILPTIYIYIYIGFGIK